MAFKGQAFDGGVVIFPCTFVVAVYCLVAARTGALLLGSLGPFGMFYYPCGRSVGRTTARFCLVRVLASWWVHGPADFNGAVVVVVVVVVGTDGNVARWG